jgi:iron complex outermembrane receptor protein
MKSRLLASSVFAGAAFMAQASMLAVAQEADEAVDTVATTTEDATARQETVYVTGSRIAQPNMTTTSPVTSVSANDVKLQGVTRVEDLVTQLPQAFAAQNSTVSNGASGTATVSLRNLDLGGSATRTLVLVDGKRLPYGSPNDAAADLNLIPGQMIERVDVLTGGASAVYGSDAIAGVVNFIMKDDFEGVQIDTQYGFYQHNNDYDTNGDLRDVIAQRAVGNPSQFALPDDNVTDGYSKEITAIMGVNTDDGRGNLTAWFGYRNNDEVLQGNRDYSACAIGSATATGFTCGGSSTSFPGRFTDFDAFNYTIDPATGEFRDFDGATDQYNYGPLNFYQRPDERYSAGFNGHYQINDYAEAYTQFMFMDYQSNAQIAPSGNFFATTSLNCDNPLLSASQAADIGCTPANIAAGDSIGMYIARRNVEGGGRQDHLGYQTYRGVAGLRGDLYKAPGWSYDVSASFAQVTLSRSYRNEFSITRLNRALNVVDDGTGTAVCASVLDGTDPNCVPWDIFTVGNVTPEALAYLQVPLLQTGTTEQNIVSGV